MTLCKVCEKPFNASNSFHTLCSGKCALKLIKFSMKAAKVKLLVRKEAIKTRTEWLASTQTAINRYSRLRDVKAGHGCICCGKPFEPEKPGGSIDAGHYLSRGSAPHLRFDERNIHAQRKNCNRPGGTTRGAFRLGMIDRIGSEALEELEADQTVKKWSIEDLRVMCAYYRAKANALAKENQA
jgi:hypothetical protein